jgi:hypothetical protein
VANNSDPQVFDPPLVVTNATISATHFTGSMGDDMAQKSFWVQDADRGMRFFLGTVLPENIQVGQRVSFKVTQANVFDGHPQITAVEDFEIHSSGNEVSYKEITNESITMDDYNGIVRLAGTVGPSSQPCGGSSVCWDLNYGANNTITLRTSSSNVRAGTCLTFIGPVMSFPGPKAVGGNAPRPQLDTINFRWLRTPPSFD